MSDRPTQELAAERPHRAHTQPVPSGTAPGACRRGGAGASGLGGAGRALSLRREVCPRFPRVPISIVRYEGDEEIPAGASVVYRADAEQLLPAEDRVVAAELLLDVLSVKPMTESEGRA